MDVNIPSALTQVLLIEDVSQVGHARRTAQQLAEQLGFDETDAGRVALVATELASNILKHAAHGELHLRASGNQGVEMIAVDRGQGFDLDSCLVDGFSTGGTQGIGMGAISRVAQVFDVYADPRGTAMLARLYPRASSAKDIRYGVSQHSLHHDPACGDAWHLAIAPGRFAVMMADGLGHGSDAERAARAGEEVFAQNAFLEATVLFNDMHIGMTGSRGGAMAVAQYDATADSLRFTGVGNIGASLIGPGKSRGLASHPGIVGVQFRKAQPFDYAEVSGQLLILYSDGLQSRWNLADYPGLSHRHPALIAAILHRDFCRGRDDVTVFVIVLEAIDG
ncbi:ATP-binding protein [Pseudomonas syringae]|uniref:ATP-binding protein n=1 Tax=Pseudomonas syringae TaxID=317 RepID=A0A9Q3ZZV7_PSESX|nr:ATP-binding protein [Pseudomonas syringae]MCF5066357.1 ATP-binding protein [Pseudomonas syringae]MCF5072224.1 ATP-binding protein [Pseudomonas syringae]MCF5120323.1 ATP-binding protein [Pseudomonas syringae]MCF5378960.1 ATP-binding protein [Pseudomonas syringae]